MWYVYIAQFSGDRLYTGITTDPERRMKQHNDGLGAKSLRGKGPIVLVYLEEHTDQTEAAKREREIKNWHRSKKILLINNSI